ncbi:QcrA and Rieske domain-containing protein [Fibrella aquatilis]|uniref:Rieske 2Fe-2S domain-containing protein n=1 Tax=Fibrella aquatilis TaxID=2817059 RepID=A0A939K2R9_9BACT|nr:Rieske 2Fe-2S domain-containing protein [Fibrella aquatilis]MBO0933595.1 Rieske 2Fe-2S domain-containing protein [Fibrella aquatilis]
MENTPIHTTPPTLSRTHFLRLIGTGIGLLAIVNSVSGCIKEAIDKPVTTLDFTVNWNQSPYSNLKTKGGYFVEKGVIVAQTQAGAFVAVSAACPDQGNTTLVFQSGNNRFYCPLHQSAFSTEGAVLNGSSSANLKKYTVTVDQATGEVRVRE